MQNAISFCSLLLLFCVTFWWREWFKGRAEEMMILLPVRLAVCLSVKRPFSWFIFIEITQPLEEDETRSFISYRISNLLIFILNTIRKLFKLVGFQFLSPIPPSLTDRVKLLKWPSNRNLYSRSRIFNINNDIKLFFSPCCSYMISQPFLNEG